jgi:DNA-binding LacI/PurR family transcriptional regulator
VEHLLRLGHRRIGMISATDPDQPGWPAPFGRAEGYYAALKDAGLPVDERLVVTVPWGETQGAAAMQRLLEVPEPLTAVFAHSDELALGAVRTLRRAGMRVPEDVSVIGIDDHPLSELTDLTTIAQPVRDIGIAAGRMVRALLRGESTECGVLLPTKLIVRGTTTRARGNSNRVPSQGVPG